MVLKNHSVLGEMATGQKNPLGQTVEPSCMGWGCGLRPSGPGGRPTEEPVTRFGDCRAVRGGTCRKTPSFWA